MGDMPEQNEVNESPTKSKLPIIIIIFVILFGVIGGIAFMIMGSSVDGEDYARPKPMETPLVVEFPEKFTGNLAAPDDQYIYSADVSVNIDPKPGISDSEAIKEFGIESEELRSKYPMILDIIQRILSSKRRTEITTSAGQDKVRMQIKQKLNQVLDKSEVVEVYLQIVVP